MNSLKSIFWRKANELNFFVSKILAVQRFQDYKKSEQSTDVYQDFTFLFLFYSQK